MKKAKEQRRGSAKRGSVVAEAISLEEEAFFIFHKYDVDSSNSLTEAELASCLSELGAIGLYRCAFDPSKASFTRQHALDWLSSEFRRADANKDGRVSFDEFVDYYNKFLGAHRSEFSELYELGSQLGKGAFGTVRVAKRRTDGVELAVKSVRKGDADIADIRNEIRIWEWLEHEGLVRLVDVHESAEKLLLVTEYMRGGDLFEALSKLDKFSERQACFVARQITSAVAYLHSREVVHCDLKTSNILVTDPVAADTPIRIKISDFGLSQTLSVAGVRATHGRGLSWSATAGGRDEGKGEGEGGEGSTSRKSGRLHQVCGTPWYFAPELVMLAQDPESSESAGYGSPVDCWAVGCILFELLVGHPPFKTQNEEVLFYQILDNQIAFPEAIFSAITASVSELILQLTRTDPVERLSCEAALKHPWFAALDAEDQGVEEEALPAARLTNLARARTERESYRASSSRSGGERDEDGG